MFISQEGKLPFPKVDPIRLPEILDMANLCLTKVKLSNDVGYIKEKMSYLEQVYRDWYRPLIDLDRFPYVYFMNNGITQSLEFLALHYGRNSIRLLQGDYFWIKTCGAGLEVDEIDSCDISYSSCPSAIDGSNVPHIWPSKIHILDGAYIGSSDSQTIYPDNTQIILLGFSKNLGLPELRTGLIFSKFQIRSLEIFQKTFAYVGIANHEVAGQICKEYPIIELSRRLKRCQLNFCKLVQDLNLMPSDTALLATTKLDLKFYKRSNGITRIPLGESISSILKTDKSMLL